MKHWFGSTVLLILLGACGFPSTYSLPPQYAILGKSVRLTLNWSPSQPQVWVGGTALSTQADPQTNSVVFQIPAPWKNNDGTSSGGGWGGPQVVEVKDGNRQARGTLYVLGRSYLASQPNTMLLLAPEGVSANQIQGFLGQTGLKFDAPEIYPLQGPGICKGSLARFKYTGDAPSFEEVLRQLDERARDNPGVVLGISPQTDYDTGAEYVPLDGREEVAAPVAHGRGFTGKGAVIAVLDTGVGLQSESEWSGRLLEGRQFTAAGESSYTGDDYVGNLTDEDGVITGANQAQGHGSQVASLAAGTQFGVAPEAKVLPVKVCDQQGKCRTGDVVRGVCWALGYADTHFKGNLKPLILNLSLGGDTGDFERDILKMVLKQAITLGATVVASAGNDWDDYLRGALYEPRSYPAAFDLDGLIAVGAVRKPVGNERFEPSTYSNRGSWVDILAPGSLVKAIDAYGQPRDNNRGTSFAAPLVTGAVALWRQKLPEASPLELQNKILENASLEHVNLSESDRERLTRRFLDLSREP